MDGSNVQSDIEARTQAFLNEITELSIKHGIAITGDPVLFVMEHEDYNSRYKADRDSKLIFG